MNILVMIDMMALLALAILFGWVYTMLKLLRLLNKLKRFTWKTYIFFIVTGMIMTEIAYESVKLNLTQQKNCLGRKVKINYEN